MTWKEIRASFLEYFERNGHRVVASSSLVPHDDPTLLFTNAGMNQFKDVFLGKEQRDYTRAASCQKCMRVSGKHNDLENVGPSPSHHTFFQMLGNFSFGDYFKKDAIAFAWELLTDVWKIPPDKLFVTVFKGEGGIPRDVEAREHWLKYVSEDHLSELGADDNFWQMGETGPCGRCSEIYYFRGNQIPCPEPVCRGVECSCSRYIEIWNNVFMEFDRQADGALKPLPAPSIDTGMGLERITAVLQGRRVELRHRSVRPDPRRDRKASPARTYGRSMSPDDVSMRVVADHSRAMTFLIADGVMPSNEFRGYVLRKIMRRAMRHGMKLGITEHVSSTARRRHRPRDGRRVSGAALEPRHGRQRRAQRRGAIRRGARGGFPGSKTLLERLPSSRKAASSRETKRSSCTTRSACRSISSRISPASARSPSIAKASSAPWRASGKRRARKAPSRARRGRISSSRPSESQQGLSAAGDRFEGYTTTTVKGTPVIALFDKERRQVKELTEGRRGLRGARADAVLRRSRADRCRTSASCTPTHQAHRRTSDGMSRIAVGHAAAAPHSADERNAARARHHHRRSRCSRRATPRAETTRRPICSMRRCEKCWDRT